MAQISRLKEAEIQNGNLINADDISAELDGLVNESNSQDTRLTNIESNAMTIAGVKTFSSAPKTNQIDENTAGAGVTIDSVRLKDGMAKVSGAPTADGEVGYDSNQFKGRRNGTVKNFLMTGDAGFPKGYTGGPAPFYNDAASWKIPAGFRRRSSDNTMDIEVATERTVSLAASGADGLDTGAEASNTNYYLYVVADSTGVNEAKGVWSTQRPDTGIGSVTLPNGYDRIAWAGIPVRNNGSSNIIPSKKVGNWVFYNGAHLLGSGTTIGATNILNAGTATSFTSVSATSYIPPFSTFALLEWASNGSSNAMQTQTNSTLADVQEMGISQTQFFQNLTSSQTFEYKRVLGSASQYIDVVAYYLPEEFA